MGQIFAVVSGKGGTGKTSLCAGIACCLAAEGAKVLCIDADIGLRNLDLSLGSPEIASLPFTEVLYGRVSPEDIPAHPKLPGLFLLTAPISEEAETIELPKFRRFMEFLRKNYDYCMIDAPAGIGAGFRLACASADRIVVVSGPDPASLRDAASVASLLADRPRGSVRLVVNRIVPKLFTRMKTTVDDMMDGAGLPLLGIVPEDVSVTLAAAEGTPLIFYTDKKAARACLNIARRLSGQAVPLMKLR